MKAEAITLLAIFSTIFLLAQLRFIRRFIRLKKRYDSIPGVLLLSDLLCCCEICTCCGDAALGGSPAEESHEQQVARQRRRDEKRREEIVRSKTALRLSEIESGESVDRSIKKDKESEIKKLVSNKQKTSLQWISTIAMVPIDTVIEILTKDPNFVIKDDYVLIQKMPVKSESTIPEDKRAIAQELREKEEKIAKGICPICNTPFEPSHEFCSNCGYVLK